MRTSSVARIILFAIGTQTTGLMESTISLPMDHAMGRGGMTWRAFLAPFDPIETRVIDQSPRRRGRRHIELEKRHFS